RSTRHPPFCPGETLPAEAGLRDGSRTDHGHPPCLRPGPQRGSRTTSAAAEGVAAGAGQRAGLVIMRLLVLGGTQVLGRAIVDEACGRGYDVTTFSRGLSGHPRPGVEPLCGDRTSPGDLRQLTQGEWDVVIDTSVL